MIRQPRKEPAARLAILVGAVSVALGIGLSGSLVHGRSVGGMVLVLGWLTLVVGIHRFGRLGEP